MKDEYTAQDFAGAIKNPYYGKLIKNGKYTVIVEHADYDEVIEVDVKTGKKTVLEVIAKLDKVTT